MTVSTRASGPPARSMNSMLMSKTHASSWPLCHPSELISRRHLSRCDSRTPAAWPPCFLTASSVRRRKSLGVLDSSRSCWRGSATISTDKTLAIGLATVRENGPRPMAHLTSA